MIPHAFREADYLGYNTDVAAAVDRGDFASGWEHFMKFGRLEGRTHRDPASMARNDKALYGLDRRGAGLEVGPSHNPIARKKDGFNVHILDHLDTQSLRAKYAGHASLGVDIDNIEEVDFVWKGEPLPETVGPGRRYDWIIASHVIEHVPNLVGFLQQCESLLTAEGRLSLVIPDKRYCFDCLNPVTSTGELLDAFAAQRRQPTPGKLFDHVANASKRNGSIAWDEGAEGGLEFVHSYAQARELWARTSAGPSDYVDVHCWRFIPESFHLLLSDLQGLGLTRLAVLSQFPTAGCEFYMSLGKVPADNLRPVDRLRALQAIQGVR